MDEQEAEYTAMHDHGDGSFDERLLLVIGAAGLALLAVFVLTPVLRPYYAVLMPAMIAAGAGGSWLLLRAGRLASPPTPTAAPVASDQPDAAGSRARGCQP